MPHAATHRWEYVRSDAGVLVRCACGARAAWVRCPTVSQERVEAALRGLFGVVPAAGHAPLRGVEGGEEPAARSLADVFGVPRAA